MNKPYRLRFHMATPIAFSANKPIVPLKGDGLFGYAWAKKNGLTKTPAEILPENIVFPELPFELVKDSYYAISAAFTPPEASMEPEMIVRRPDWAAVMGKNKVGNFAYQTSVGPLQGQQEQYWLLVTPYVDFYCRGELNSIGELLEVIINMRYLGAKRSVGYGMIANIEVHPAEMDYSEWKDGKPTRNIPVSLYPDRQGLPVEIAPFRPPYWHKAFCAPCYVPALEQYLPGANMNGTITQASDYLQNIFQTFQQNEAKKEQADKDKPKKRKGGK